MCACEALLDFLNLGVRWGTATFIFCSTRIFMCTLYQGNCQKPRFAKI